MPTRDINEYLESGEIDEIKKGGNTPGDTLQDTDEIDATIATALIPVNLRLDALETTHSLILDAFSTAATQEPLGTDTPLQIEFGAAQGSVSDPVMLAANGTITFNEAGRYIVNFIAHYGRTGSTGTSVLLFRNLIDNAFPGRTLATKLDSAEALVPWISTGYIDAEVGTIVTSQMMRDSSGNDSGGLFEVPVTLAGWDSAPCAAIRIYKAA